MKSDKEFCILLFHSIHQVMRAENVISKYGYSYQIIPVPSEYSSECGMCIEIDSSIITIITPELQKYNIEPKVVKR
ncbi:MAG: DUF3343 domain-containing protein [Bacteroidales bacterium]